MSTPKLTSTITSEDIEESARVWASIDAENATRIPDVVDDTPKREATDRALAQGWHVDPEDSQGRPHDGPCDCEARSTTGYLKWCLCPCHGFGGKRQRMVNND